MLIRKDSGFASALALLALLLVTLSARAGSVFSDSASTQLDKVVKTLSAVSGQLESVNDDIKAQEAEIDSIEKAISDKDRDTDALRKRLQGVSDVLDDIGAELSDIGDTLDDARETLEKLGDIAQATRNKDLVVAVKQAFRTLEGHEQEMRASRETVAAARDDVARLNKALDTSK